MKKLLTLTFLLSGLLSTELSGQGIGVDQLEQTKRMARRNNHITKTYKGEVVKMLFGKSPYGGEFNGIIFRKPDGKLLHLRISSFHGESIGPHIKEGQRLEVTLSGDELLLDVVLYKDQFLRSIEVKLKEPISGLGHLESVKTPKGFFEVKKASRTISTPSRAVVNARVTRRIKLDNKGAILELDNGDSLYFKRTGLLEDVFQQDYISYLRRAKSGHGRYYKSLNVHYISSDKWDFLPIPESNFDASLAMLYNILLEEEEIELSGFSSNRAGLVNSLVAKTGKNKTDTFRFSTRSAKAINDLVSGSTGVSLKVYYQKGSLGKYVRAIGYNGEILRTAASDQGFPIEKNYIEQPVRFTGKVTDIQYRNGKRFRSMILDDSVHITINEVIELSIASLLKTGTEVTIEGWKRKSIPTEINEKGYAIILPKKVTVDGRTFTNRRALTFD